MVNELKKTIQYFSIEERENIILENSHLVLIEERNITEGNFLVFSDTLPEKEVEYVNVPKKEFELLKAQNEVLVDKTEFHEEVLTEIILAINP